MTTIRLLITTISFLLLSSCGLLNNDDDPIAGVEDVYEGIYYQGIEDSYFVPCIDQEAIWGFDEVPESFYETLFEELFKNEGIRPLYLNITGTPTKKGKYNGFFISYERTLNVKELNEIRQARENHADCVRKQAL